MSDLLRKVRLRSDSDGTATALSTASDAESGLPALEVERTDEAIARGDLPLDKVFDALAKARRRWTLQYLLERDEQVSLSDLAEHVAAIENGTTPAALGSQERKRVYVSLYQCHLPKLEDMNVVDYDGNRGHVELGPAAPELFRYLKVDDVGSEAPTGQHYVGFVLVGALATTLAALLGAVGAVAAAGLFGAICVGLFGMAVSYAVLERRR